MGCGAKRKSEFFFFSGVQDLFRTCPSFPCQPRDSAANLNLRRLLWLCDLGPDLRWKVSDLRGFRRTSLLYLLTVVLARALAVASTKLLLWWRFGSDNASGKL